jgi:hypothetical protein
MIIEYKSIKTPHTINAKVTAGKGWGRNSNFAALNKLILSLLKLGFYSLICPRRSKALAIQHKINTAGVKLELCIIT